MVLLGQVWKEDRFRWFQFGSWILWGKRLRFWLGGSHYLRNNLSQGCGIKGSCDIVGNLPLYMGGLVFGNLFLLYQRRGHFPQPWCVIFEWATDKMSGSLQCRFEERSGRTPCHETWGYIIAKTEFYMALVGKQFTFLLIVFWWETPTYLLKIKLLLPFQRQPSLGPISQIPKQSS